MVKFLLQRPIATCMSFIALFILGLISYQRLPISLLPDIDIPEITVRASYDSYTAQEMENRVAGALRRNLQQCAGLISIESESSNGQSTIKLIFRHGTDIDLASIEANEKIDRVMQWMPREIPRPIVIKASATDIPVFFLNMSYADNKGRQQDFLDLSRFAQHVIKKRLEQLSEVGFVDVSGIDSPQISIVPDEEKLSSYGVTFQYLENVIKSNNFNIGNITINEGHYQYQIRVSSPMASIEQIRELMLFAGGKIFKLGDLAEVNLVAKKKAGLFMDGAERAISMAIIKQADAKMQDLKTALNLEMDNITEDYPHLRFDIAQDQTALLDYSIENLKQTLAYGAFLAFIVLFLFIPNFRLPLLMGLTVPIALVISVLFLMLFGISINIISLSGLVLGIGLMIDNAIIVIDNISQFRERGISLFESCTQATNEVIRPLLSSALTTSAVFIPLVFVSGVSGALFFDQAVTVTISLLLSFIISITLLPVIYLLLHQRKSEKEASKKKPILNLEKPYNYGFKLVMGNKVLFTILFLLLIPLSAFLVQVVDKQSFPSVKENALIADVKWTENISSAESYRRFEILFNEIKDETRQFNAWIGLQDYLLNNAYDLKRTEARIYISGASPQDLQTKIASHMRQRYPAADVEFSRPENLFTKTFAQSDAPLILQLKPTDKELENDSLLTVISLIDKELGRAHLNSLGQYSFINLSYDREKLILYSVKEGELLRAMKTAFNENEIGSLNTSNEVLPIVIGMDRKSLNEIINKTWVMNNDNKLLPARLFLNTREEVDFEVVNAGKDGVYVPIHYEADESERKKIESKASNFIAEHQFPFNISWRGALYDFENNLKELVGILMISIILLYFILAIQFESLLQPIIILLEIPIDLAGSVLFLMMFGNSLNIMSAIGIVVMTGIIINDSILKLDTINRFHRHDQLPLMEAIHLGGVRRIRPIIMTSATTMLALMPFLFGDGLGTELQKPLALAIIGGLGLGTIISLYFIPLCYWWIYHKKKVS